RRSSSWHRFYVCAPTCGVERPSSRSPLRKTHFANMAWVSRASTSALLVLVAIVASGCATTSISNERFSSAQLMRAARNGPWPMSNFVPPSEALPPSNTFEGRLQLEPDRSKAQIRVLRDRYGLAAKISPTTELLPEFDFEFVQTADALVPVV